MPQCIAFHSYKGGTGKTTIAANLAAVLAAKGYNVSLLDLDVYAPSLYSYFEYTPRKWINDYLFDDAEVDDLLVEMAPVLDKFSSGSPGKGKLWVGYSDPQKESVYKMEGMSRNSTSQIEVLRRFIQLREELLTGLDCDYVIMDTSPGIRYWSINSLAIADTIFLTLKFGDLDIEGTKKIANEIYGSFTKFGAKSYLLLNRVAGYCVPHVAGHGQTLPDDMDGSDFGSVLSKQVDMDVISSIPCYCDIQFSRKEFLTALQYPDHPFARQLERIAASDRLKV